DLDQLIAQAETFTQQPRRAPLNALSACLEQVLATRRNQWGNLPQLVAIIKGLITDVTETGQLFGFTTEHMTVEQAWAVGRLAEMCGTEERPEASWLDLERLQQVQRLIERLRPAYEEVSQFKQDLRQRFDESLFDLDVDRLLESFGSASYRPPLRWFNPRY